jgi:hypothetical protein
VVVDRSSPHQSGRRPAVELLAGADDANHVVDSAGLADWLASNGFAPDCLASPPPRPHPDHGGAGSSRPFAPSATRADDLDCRGATGGQGLTLEFADNLRAGVQVVSDFVGATSTLTVHEPAYRGAGRRPCGHAPYQVSSAAGITTWASSSMGYQP